MSEVTWVVWVFAGFGVLVVLCLLLLTVAYIWQEVEAALESRRDHDRRSTSEALTSFLYDGRHYQDKTTMNRSHLVWMEVDRRISDAIKKHEEETKEVKSGRRSKV